MTAIEDSWASMRCRDVGNFETRSLAALPPLRSMSSSMEIRVARQIGELLTERS
jgi:hypothetical protein